MFVYFKKNSLGIGTLSVMQAEGIVDIEKAKKYIGYIVRITNRTDGLSWLWLEAFRE